MNRIKNIMRTWLPLAVVVTAMAALVFLTVQQALRQGANDPQIQMAEDTAAALDHGASAESAVPRERVELASSLAPFVVLYDASGKPVAGSGMLDGALPEYPTGALQASKQGGQNHVTWQPREGVRIASIVVPYQAGYVMAGRSLREVE
ncbi:MAG: hypothetical protein ACM3MF_07275 [Anaerolineae bacterium]